MEAGMVLHAGGSWEKPSGDFPNGRLVAGNGLVKAELVSTGVVKLTLHYPVSANSCACVVTERTAGGPTFGTSWNVAQTSNTEKTVHFEFVDGAINVSFDFIIVKFAQPQQGLGG